jgi:hypothetical protein
MMKRQAYYEKLNPSLDEKLNPNPMQRLLIDQSESERKRPNRKINSVRIGKLDSMRFGKGKETGMTG